MADIKISQLPTATSVNDADIFVMDQGLVTKTATRTQIVASVTPASIGAMATSERATYATTASVAAITAASLGALSTAQAVTIAQGGTGQTTQQSALNAIAGAVTANQVLKGNGTNVVLGALTSADIPTLPIAKLSGVAASGANSDITSVALTTGTVSTNPSGVTDIVNKAYADSIGSGVNFHDACDYGTLAVLSPTTTYNQPVGTGVGATLTGQANTALQIDGVTVAVDKRVLVKNQTNAFENGVYNVTRQGDGSTVPYILTRAADYDTSGSGINEVQAGDFILILSSTLANTAWVQQTPAPIIFGTTSISFIQFAAAAAGVSSFNTSLTGLTPSTNTTGAVTLAGTLGVASGGSGQSTQAAAITALTGTQTSGTYLRSNGTNAALAAIQAGDVPTLNQNTSGTAAGLSSTLAIASGGTAATTAGDALYNLGSPMHYATVRQTIAQTPDVIGTYLLTYSIGNPVVTCTNAGGSAGLTVGSTFSPSALRAYTIISISGNGTDVTMSGSPSVGATAQSNSAYRGTNTTFTFPAGAQAATEGHTVEVGDVVFFTTQNASAQNGPWLCTTKGAIGVSQVFTRPSWFTGTSYLLTCMMLRGTSSQGVIYSLWPSTAIEAEITVGVTQLSVVLIAGRGVVAVLGGNTFTGKNTFQAGSLGSGAVPFAFQAGVLMTTPQAHAVEWDSTQMYLTNSAAERLPVATSKAQINNQTGTAYPIVLADAGYLVTLNNTAGVSVTIPTDASIAFPIGTQILLMQTSTTGTVTVSAVTAGTTSVVGKNGLKTSGQYAVISLIKIAANSWVVAGDATV